VLQPGAPFVFSVPNHRFVESLSVGKVLDRVGLGVLGDIYRDFFDRISRHYHCDPPDVWHQRLGEHGFEIKDWWDYFSPGALHTLEWGHYFGLPSLLCKWLTGRWILAPAGWNVWLTWRLIRKHYRGGARHKEGAYTFYIARRL